MKTQTFRNEIKSTGYIIAHLCPLTSFKTRAPETLVAMVIPALYTIGGGVPPHFLSDRNTDDDGHKHKVLCLHSVFSRRNDGLNRQFQIPEKHLELIYNGSELKVGCALWKAKRNKIK
ncbi:hypothetical protein AMECASPLE_029673 [Ameca splendens]|uniref:Uncharacterized protein n=1 Tax=Ameca splendens TaxID=208324 RepID=A0ABV0Y5S7_9TELE